MTLLFVGTRALCWKRRLPPCVPGARVASCESSWAAEGIRNALRQAAACSEEPVKVCREKLLGL